MTLHVNLPPAPDGTYRLFAAQLSGAMIGQLIRFYVEDENRQIVTLVTGELRQLSHNGSEVVVHIGYGAEVEHVLNRDTHVIVNPRSDYSEVAASLGNDLLGSMRIYNDQPQPPKPKKGKIT